MTSALTTSIIGGMKTIAQTVIGSFNFGGISKNWETYVGISLNLIGSMLYIFKNTAKLKRHPTEIARKNKMINSGFHTCSY
jgi:branched-subunit amino acid ABC-type transport system permease component